MEVDVKTLIYKITIDKKGMNFLRNFIAAFLALLVFSGIIIVIIVSVAMDSRLTEVEKDSILQIKFNLPVTEREMENPLDGLGVNIGPASSIGLVELRRTLRHAAKNENIKGVYLDMEGLQAGWSSIEEIRTMLLEFRKSGKFIVAYAKYFSEPAYYLSSVADEIYMHPEGDLEFNGLAANLMFFKGTFEKLDIEPEVFRVGEFKSAIEPLIREDMSDESRLQMESLLNSINDQMLLNISEMRDIPVDSLEIINDDYLIRTSEDAVRYRMISGLAYIDEVRDILKTKAGVSEENDLEMISYSNYQGSYIPELGSSKNRIAVIVASGEIVMGKGDFATIGSDKYIEEIRNARETDNVKAVVLRINSPGGSFVASDALWREISLTSEVKPVVASMGDAAASGGYYMAMACDTIVANPTTITGSIGIFSVLFNIKGFLNNKLGITTDVVTTGEFSDMYSSDRPLTERERAIIQKETELSYGTFISKAARGRNMTEEAILEIASGRVWSGSKALELGLVDVLGDTETSIEIAAEMAGISEDYGVRYYPPQDDFLEVLFGSGEEARTKMAKEELGTLYIYLEQIKKLERLQGIQARSLYELEIY
jgi:protease IV